MTGCCGLTCKPPLPGVSSEQISQSESCNKSADVRHVSHAACICCLGNGTNTAKQLQNDP